MPQQRRATAGAEETGLPRRSGDGLVPVAGSRSGAMTGQDAAVDGGEVLARRRHGEGERRPMNHINHSCHSAINFLLGASVPATHGDRFVSTRRGLLSSKPIVTDVESPSTVPSSTRFGRRGRAASVAGAVVTVLLSMLVAPTRPAAADSLSAARSRAAQITGQLSADQQRLDVTSQQYDAAQQRAAQIDGQMAKITAQLGQDQAQVTSDRARLRDAAVSAYMTGSADTTADSIFSSSGVQAAAADEYRSVASGDVSGAIDALGVAQSHLAQEQSQLQAARDQAQAALAQAAAAQQSAQATVADQESVLSHLKGQIATLVASQQAAQQAASHTAFVARLNGATLPNLPAAGGAGTAIAAAQSQLGVPYRWGGESPGGGFDCSGLVQWAWRQAGVSLPRTAAAQYGAVAHVPLSSMEPGDLVFWGGGGGISHVGIYVGGGSVIDAPTTGQVVRIQPIWNDGLVGAGRP
jgi:cell wall-associated NlpC family hydrolase